MAKSHSIPIELSEKDIARFWSKVDRSGGPDACWDWQGSRDSSGYGTFGLGTKTLGTHRVAWTIANGPIPDKMLVCHRCDNPPCANPSHHFLGTYLKNARDREDKGRGGSCFGERNPFAKLTDEQVSEIRRAYALGGVTQTDLAVRYGVSQVLIGLVVNRKAWKHVKDERAA